MKDPLWCLSTACARLSGSILPTRTLDASWDVVAHFSLFGLAPANVSLLGPYLMTCFSKLEFVVIDFASSCLISWIPSSLRSTYEELTKVTVSMSMKSWTAEFKWWLTCVRRGPTLARRCAWDLVLHSPDPKLSCHSNPKKKISMLPNSVVPPPGWVQLTLRLEAFHRCRFSTPSWRHGHGRLENCWCRPVMCDTHHSPFSGATCSNNTAELTRLAEALRRICSFISHGERVRFFFLFQTRG